MAKPLADMERLFRALADATRLRILGLLLSGEVCVCHIHESLRIPQPKASRHLAYLRRAGLVKARRDGLWVRYRLADPRDAAAGAIREAVIRSLGPIDTVRRDVIRLSERTGCCVPPELLAGVSPRAGSEAAGAAAANGLWSDALSALPVSDRAGGTGNAGRAGQAGQIGRVGRAGRMGLVGR